MEKIIKVISVFLIALLGISLTACGNKTEDAEEGDKYVYTASFDTIDLNLENAYVSASVVKGDFLYVYISNYDPDSGESTGCELKKINISTKEEENIAIESLGSGYVNQMHVYDDGSFGFIIDNYDYNTGDEAISLVNASAEGTVTGSTDVTDVLEDKLGQLYFTKAVFSEDGTVYLSSGQSIIAFSREGVFINKVDTSNWISDIFLGSDNTLYVKDAEQVGDNYEGVLYKYDTVKNELTDKKEGFSTDGTLVCGINGDFISLNSSSVKKINKDSLSEEKLWDWISVDISEYDASNFSQLDTDKYMMTETTYEGDKENFEIVYFTKVLASKSEKTILKLACMQVGWGLKEQIIAFNKTNPDYRIEVEEFYDESEDWDTALNKLNVALTKAGDIDIVDLSSIGYEDCKEGLEDLDPYFEKDTDINKADYFENIIECFKTDGKLLYISPFFNVTTMMVPKSLVESYDTWNMDALLDLRSKNLNKVFFAYGSRGSVISYMLNYGLDEYIDEETGKCNFETEEFYKLLDFIKTFPEDFDYDNYDDWESIQNKDTLITVTSLSDVEEVEIYSELFGEDLTLAGFPTEEGGVSPVMALDSIGMAAKSDNKDGAWEFIKTLLSKDYAEKNAYNGFSIIKSVFNDTMEEAMKVETYTDENGVVQKSAKGSWGNGNITIDYYGTSQETADQIRACVENAATVSNADDQIMSIITEEAAPFFEGQKTAEDVASIIQSRVQIYLAENR